MKYPLDIVLFLAQRAVQTHSDGMSKPKSYKQLADDTRSSDIQTLELLIERAETIYKDLGELIRSMDRVRLDKLAVGQPAPDDFLVMKKKTIPKGRQTRYTALQETIP